MAYADTVYTFRLGPELLERGRANVVTCPAYRDGALAEPSSGTLTVYSPNGTAVVDAQAVTVTGSIAQYSIASATVTSYPYADGWTLEWSLVMPDGVTHTVRTDGALVRRSFYPVITDADIIARVPSLDPDSPTVITSSANYQDELDEGWRVLVRRLVADGNLPQQIVSSYALREPHLVYTLSLILADLATRSEGQGFYAEEAGRYRGEYEAAYRRARAKIDRAEDGSVGTGRQPVQPITWLGGGASWLI